MKKRTISIKFNFSLINLLVLAICPGYQFMFVLFSLTCSDISFLALVKLAISVIFVVTLSFKLLYMLYKSSIVFSLILVYRVIKGPNIIDRVLSADAIDILAGIIMILFGVLENRAMYLDLGFIITLLGFIGTVLISKYIKGEL